MKILTDIIPIVSVAILITLRVLELKTRRATTPGSIRERWTLWAFIGLGAIMAFGGMAEYLYRLPPLSGFMLLAGWAVGISSILLRRSAIRALGRYWSLHSEIRRDQPLVSTGPFRWIRHPTYLSMVLELGAFAVILQAWYTAALVTVFFIPILAWRIQTEEAALINQLGSAYRAYRRERPALIPYKGPLKE